MLTIIKILMIGKINLPNYNNKIKGKLQDN